MPFLFKYFIFPTDIHGSSKTIVQDCYCLQCSLSDVMLGTMPHLFALFVSFFILTRHLDHASGKWLLITLFAIVVAYRHNRRKSEG
jgi:hypothetical protein